MQKLIQQPNGKFALYTTVCDAFFWVNRTLDEARIWLQAETGWGYSDPDWQAMVTFSKEFETRFPRKRWNDAIKMVERIYGADSARDVREKMRSGQIHEF